MDSLTYAVAVFILAFSMQYDILWLSLAIFIFLLVSLRSLSGILLTLITGAVFFVFGGQLQGEMLYIAVGLVVLAYFIGVKPSEEQGEGGLSPEMMAALQGLEGGGGYGGYGGTGGMGGYQ